MAQYVAQSTRLDGAAGSQLGWKTAMNADGTIAVVGAPGENGNVGAAYVYAYESGNWVLKQLLTANDSIGAARQGSGVAISADGNTIAVGGLAHDTDKGAVWFYQRSAGVWTQQGAAKMPSDASGTAKFGSAVSLSVDGNTAAIGGGGDALNLGAAWIFQRSAGVWSQFGTKLQGEDNTGSTMGAAIAISGDGNTVVAGGNIYNLQRGAFWFFVRGVSSFVAQGGIRVLPDAVPSTRVGGAVALSHDGNRALIGASGRGTSGAVLVWTRSGGVWQQQTELTPTGATADASFGSALSLSGDGVIAAIGGYGDDDSFGAYWIFSRSGELWSQGPKSVGANGAAAGLQGAAISVSSDSSHLVLGGPFTNGTGSVWFFTGGPDPAISKTHTMEFNQGQNLAAYKLTVTNVGSLPTNGTITVVETPPAKMILQEMLGAGWTCVFANATCSRSDVLQAGQSYPEISVKVLIATDAPPVLTNVAAVSGGGDINASNNVGSDATPITARPDLSVAVTHNGTFKQGGTGQFVVTVSNIGTVASVSSSISFTLGAGSTVSSITPAAGAVISTSTSGFSGTLPAVNPGSTAIFLVNVNVAANASANVSATGSITGGNDYFGQNNNDTDSAPVNATTGLSISKTHSTVFRQGDTNRVYTITVSNQTAAPITGTTTVTDILPASIPVPLTATTISGPGWDCTLATLTCTRNETLQPNVSFPPISVVVNVSNTAPASVVNTASVAGGATTVDITSIVAATDMTITKTHSGIFREGAQNLSYTIIAKNSGGTATSGVVTVVDTLPAGITATNMSGAGWLCTLATTTCTRQDSLAPGASYPAITLLVNVGTAAVSGNNVATVSGGGELNVSNNTAIDPTDVTTVPDLTVLSTHFHTFAPGQEGATYELTVTNIGGAPTSGVVTVSDTLPAGLTATAIGGDGWSCNLSILTCTRSSALAGSSSYPPVFVTVNVSSSFANGTTVTNRATVSGGGDLNNSNNTSLDSTTIGSAIDMVISGNTGTPTFNGGQIGATYNIVAVNSGSQPTNGALVSVAVVLPPKVTASSFTGPGGWTCSLQVLRCTSSAILQPGNPQNFTLTVNVAPDAPAAVITRLTVAGGGESNTSNNLFSITTGVNLFSDLQVTKEHVGNFSSGQIGATYRITITNRGGAASSGNVWMVDLLPSAFPGPVLTGDGWTSGVLTMSRNDSLPPGASFPPIFLTSNVRSTAQGNVVNTVQVFNNSKITQATDPTLIIGAPDLTISKIASNGPFTQGQTNATYTITVSNGGAVATAAGNTVSVRDYPPAGLTVTSISGAGWSCAGTTLICNRSDALPASSSYPPITVVATVSTGAVSPLISSATVSGGGEVKTDNNTGTASTTVSGAPDVQITKFHSGNFRQGQTSAPYTIRVRNIGSVATSGVVTVVDTLPAALTKVSMSGANWNCTLATLTCTNIANLSPNVDYDIVLMVNVPTSTSGTVTNVATVSGGGEVNTSNNTASDPTSITLSPDLAVSKTHTGNFYRNQTGAVYTITVTNVGGALAAGQLVTVVDTLPANMTATLMSGLGWNCTGVTCTREDGLAANSSFPPISLRVNIDNAAPSSVVNQVAVSSAGEINAGNNVAQDPTIISAGADLTISKTHPGTSVAPGGAINYTLTVSNIGVAATDGSVVTVQEVPPAELTVNSMGGSGWSCAPGPLYVTCTRNTVLAAGASYPPITVTATMSGGASGTVTNYASVFGGGDTVMSNNQASDPISVVAAGQPDLRLTTTPTGIWTRGTQREYTLTVTNSGTGVSSGTVSVVDTVPAGLLLQAMYGSGWICNFATRTCTRSDALAPGNSYPIITVRVLVMAQAPSPVTNVATVSGGGDTSTANNTSSYTTTIQ